MKWGLWITSNGRPNLQLWVDDPRQTLTWKSYLQPIALGEPFNLTESELGLSIDDLARLHPVSTKEN